MVFLGDGADPPSVQQALVARLPERFGGWPVSYGWDRTPVTPHVTVTTLPTWFTDQLGFDPTGPLSMRDWLLLPQQRLLGVTAGAVYADDAGDLQRVRARLAWYPEEVWCWLLACQWHRLAQEEAFVGRTAEVGDDTGSAVVAARLVRDLMRLALLLARTYAPYQKWLGTAFVRTAQPDDLPACLAAAVSARELAQREEGLAAAYTALARRHNAAGIWPAVDPATRDYYGRPGRVLMADRLAEACLSTVTDAALRALPLIGSIDQVLDSTDALASPALCRRLAVLYRPVEGD